METVFVTGGTGKIGRYLVGLLVSKGFKVKVLTRGKENLWSGISNLELIKGDILNMGLVEKSIKGCDYIFHLAVYQNANDKGIAISRQVNVSGTKVLFDSLFGMRVKKIVYVSTAMVFQDTGKIPRDENWPQKKNCIYDNYLQTKIEALAMVREMKKNLPIVIVYPTAVMDLKDFSSSAPATKGNLQRFLWEKLGGGIPGGLVNLIGPKDRIFNYAAVEDVAEGIFLAALNGKEGEGYILGGENITVADYLERASKKIGKKPSSIRIPLWVIKVFSKLGGGIFVSPIISSIAKYGLKDICFSSDKAIKNIGYNPKTKI
ncbi:MAG: NAD-dependent epimerase/dehydratase family protein [Candidatus Omnitrophica bacterium]|nr:NAD-dependent epimerase/dehydratase family protein [Candidatus Omnitrophota bacterium]